MCGICGMYGITNNVALRQMCRAMTHRGPDDEGLYIDEQIALGMRRLSIIDISGGHQPISNEDQSLWVVLNGEIYNYLDLRNILESKGHTFYTKTDTEVIPHLYESYQDDFLHYLRGKFAFALWDKKKKRLLLARDRLGLIPLYYSFQGNKLLFASELKSLLASGLIERRVNFEGIDHYLSFRGIPPPYTIFEGIYSLLPGHILSLQEGKVNISQYWEILSANPSSGRQKEEYYAERLRELLEESIKIRLISEVPLGAFLSGGMDSSAVVAFMNKLMDEPVKTFSIGFDRGGEKFNEINYARSIAKLFHTDHLEYIVTGNDILQNLPNIIWAMDQPTGDGINAYFISHLASNRVSVALAGTGPDELFGGYRWFNSILFLKKLDNYWTLFPQTLRNRFTKQFFLLPPYLRQNTILRKIETFLRCYPSLDRKFSYVGLLFKESEKELLYSEDFSQQIQQRRNSLDIIKDYVDRVTDLPIINQISYLIMKLDLLNVILRDTDVMSMAHSLEIRLPWLDHKLVEFATTIPAEMKIKGKTVKYIAKKSLEDLLPPEIVKREKRGFIFPMDIWLNEGLKPIIDATLSREAVEKRGYFCYEAIKKLYDDFYDRNKEGFFKVWNLAILELWHRLYIDTERFGEMPGNINDLI